MKRALHPPRILLFQRKRWSAALCLCLAALMFYLANYPSAVGASATTRQLPIYCVQQDQKLVSISFDAAWGNEDTQQLIDILDRYQVKATFFVVGEWVDKYPESVAALHQAGHEVMNHSNTHAHYPQLSAQEIISDLNACNDKIEAVTGVRPTLVRLPYGDYNDCSINAVRSIGMEPIQWDVDSLDWKDISANEITKRVTCKVQPGSIVLFHNAALHTPEALPSILETLLQDGYTFVPISQLIMTGDYTIDHTGRQCPAS
ncbi:polysaccharide deacetylase family protein [Flavonifractor sp. An100]|uniref:polysaccharide deacetylase family protein n=1 Tax=Flavonifractor sp. An100 TaxID=1965538 RepID=UPI000B381953|nr:polysaccharide deacetylase family protein [Flavonifractor sp. An100]OUQ78478.1 deacetylase [Flavonifractor sp. An100]